MEKRNTLLLTVIAVATLLVAVVGATFAYFASAVNTGAGVELNTTTMANASAFTATGAALNLGIEANEMLQAEGADGNVADEASADLVVKFASAAADTEMSCTYDIAFQWGNKDKYTAHSPEVAAGTKEFTIQAAAVHTETTNSTSGTNNIATETDLVDIVGTKTDKVYVVEDAVIWNNTTTENTSTWTFTAKFYNLAADQSGYAGKNFVGTFTVENVVC